jgi:hypothetical protein
MPPRTPNRALRPVAGLLAVRPHPTTTGSVEGLSGDPGGRCHPGVDPHCGTGVAFDPHGLVDDRRQQLAAA